MFTGRFDFTERTLNLFSDPACPVQVAQKDYELRELVSFVKERGPKKILEIGSYYGGTLRQWFGIVRAGGHVVSVDLPPGDFGAMWASWAPAGVAFDLVTADSRLPSTLQTVKSLGMMDVDFLFIDGDHAYETARSDFDTYGPLVRPGGVIAFHDIIGTGVEHLWHEIQVAGYWTRELKCAVHQTDMGIGIVFVPDREIPLSRW